MISLMVVMNTILNGSSSAVIRGFNMINIVYSLRFLNVNYPPNVLYAFYNRPKLDVYIKFKKFKDESLGNVDTLKVENYYKLYKVSPYLFNNISTIFA